MTTAATPETDASHGVSRRLLSTTDLALVASFAALIAVCSYAAAIPVGGAGVPITLQTFAVLLAGLVLGPLRGLLAVVLYYLLGIAGLPVFAEHSAGASVFTGPTAGYLYSFALVALVAGAIVRYALFAHRTRALLVFIAALVGVVVNHLGGIVGLHVVLDLGWHRAAGIDGVYWVGDIVKAAVAAIVAAEVHRAFPALLRRRG
jgi:biotin transport system substrate-specific component